MTNEPPFDSLRITIPPSPHRVVLTIRPMARVVSTEILDIPDGDFCCPTVPLIVCERITDEPVRRRPDYLAGHHALREAEDG